MINNSTQYVILRDLRQRIKHKYNNFFLNKITFSNLVMFNVKIEKVQDIKGQLFPSRLKWFKKQNCYNLGYIFLNIRIVFTELVRTIKY